MTIEEVVQELYWIKTGTVLNQEAYDALDIAIEKLKDMYEAKWQKVSAEKHKVAASYIYTCSKCGGTSWRKTKYCPICGTQMR